MPENTTDQNTEIPENEAQINSDGLSPTPEGVETGEPSGNREAAKYRTRLREAEAQRDALAQRVERFQRNEIEHIARAHLASPADLLTLSGNQLSDYLTESGDIDPEKINADAAVILAERPGLRKPVPATDPTQGHGSPAPRDEPSWGALLQP